MPFTPTPLTESGARIGTRKVARYVWLPDFTGGPQDVTAADINGGTDLTCDINSASGFTATDSYAETPDLCSDVTGKVWDGASLADSSISFYLRNNQEDALNFFTSGDEGLLIQAPYGLEDELPALAWDMQVGTVLPPVAIGGASLVNVAFAPRAMERITLPTSA